MRADGGTCLFGKGTNRSGSDVSVTTQFERQHTIGLRIEWNEREGSEEEEEEEEKSREEVSSLSLYRLTSL